MLSIRMTRTGKKKQPMYRIVIMDKRRDPWGKALEILGNRNPRTKETVVNEERIKYWLGQGAEVTASLQNVFIDLKLMTGKKASVTNISDKRKAKMAKKAAAAA